MSNDREIQGEFQDNYRYAHDYWAPFTKDAEVFTLAASGYTWSDAERAKLVKNGREPIEFNIMRRPLEFFSGYLRDNINQIIYSPVEGSDQKTADQLTKLSYYIWDKGKGFPTFLSASDEMFKSGISLCGIQMDYSKDFINGDISFFKRTYNSFFLDPTFETIDLSDCAFAITRDLLDQQYAKQLLPFIDANEIDNIAGSYRDDKFMQYHPQFSTFARRKSLIAYDQYYKRTTRKRKFLVDLDANFYRDITDYGEEDLKKLEHGIKRFADMRRDADTLGIDPDEVPNVEIRNVDRPYVELNIFLNGHCVYQGDDRTGVVDTYPFAPLICYMEPSIWMPSQRIQGLASCDWSLQRQFNKRHMKIFDMMDSDISTGFKYLLGSVKDPSDMQQTGQNKLIGVDPDNAPEGLNSVQQLTGGTINPAMIEYQSVLHKLSLTLSNVTEATLGIDEKGNTQISGRLAQVRIAQGLRGNRKIFDNIETSQQVLGSVILKAIQANYPPGKIERILAEEPTDQFYETQFDQYDAVIKEGVRSKSQKDAYYYELVNLKKEEIVNVPESAIIDALSMAGLSDLEEHIQKQEEQKAEQEQKIDEQERMALELANSQKIANLSLSKEREARVHADIGLAEERHSEAASNQADAVLARAKAMTEIQSLDENRIIQVYTFIEQMHRDEQVEQDKIREQTKQQADEIDARDEIRHASKTQTSPSASDQSQQGAQAQNNTGV